MTGGRRAGDRPAGAETGGRRAGDRPAGAETGGRRASLRSASAEAPTSSINRRDFVRRVGGGLAGVGLTGTGLAGAGLAGLGLVGCSSPVEPEDSPGALHATDRPLRVVVVGAGMAGLVAAYELSRGGHEVTVLEARDRVGGRVLTLRSPFGAGHSAEAGAARIPPEHDLTLGYARHFGLETDRFYPEDGLFLRFRNGARTTIPAGSFLSEWPDFVKIRGGTDRLPAAFAAELAGRVATASPVTEIVAGSTVRTTTGNGQRHESDRVLVTVPVPLLSGIRFSPVLSAGKTEAMNGGFDYQSATRVFVRFRTRFWEADGLNGWGTTDWPEELWHPTWDAPGPEGILLTYVRAGRAEELDALDADARLARVLAHWERFLPGASAQAASGASHSWQRDPWSRAAWAAPTLTQDSQLTEELARPEGPFHFAGEHISGARGWMNGAIESGLRAAREIHGS